MAKKLRRFWTKEDRLFVTISETGSRNDRKSARKPRADKVVRG